jgi:hypothetical protein
MGVFQGDVIIKAMIDLGLEEMRKNLWLFDQAFESLKAIQYVSDKYGQANIDAAKEWFKNNKIDVYMRPRNDKDVLPFVSILPGGSQEKTEMKLLGDLTPYTKKLLPVEIGKPIPYVVKPFTPIGYIAETGILTVDTTTPGYGLISPGMVLVNPANGDGYVIQNVIGNSILIEPGIEIAASQLGVVPKHQYYEARIEHTFNQETYSIGCYAHGDPQNLIWLHTIVYYAIMRYREMLLERNGFAESVVSSGEIAEDPNYEGPGGEQAFVRFITLTGQVEQSWIKAPKRFIETLAFKEKTKATATVPAQVQEIPGVGIKIISNENTPPIIDPTQQPWNTIVGRDDEDEG